MRGSHAAISLTACGSTVMLMVVCLQYFDGDDHHMTIMTTVRGDHDEENFTERQRRRKRERLRETER